MSIIDQVPIIVQSACAVASLIVGVLTYKLIKEDYDKK